MYNECRRSEQLAFDILKREFPKATMRKATQQEDIAGTDFHIGSGKVQVKEQKTALCTGRFSFEIAIKDREEGWKEGNHYSNFSHYMLTADCETFYYVRWCEIEEILDTTAGDFWDKENFLDNVGNYSGNIVVRSLSPSVLEKQRLSGHRHLDSISLCVPISRIAEVSQIFHKEDSKSSLKERIA
jgi:hypothetical protein